jgi:hypothetical protein
MWIRKLQIYIVIKVTCKGVEVDLVQAAIVGQEAECEWNEESLAWGQLYGSTRKVQLPFEGFYLAKRQEAFHILKLFLATLWATVDYHWIYFGSESPRCLVHRVNSSFSRHHDPLIQPYKASCPTLDGGSDLMWQYQKAKFSAILICLLYISERGEERVPNITMLPPFL